MSFGKYVNQVAVWQF